MTDFLLFLGKLVVVGVAGSISFFVFSGKGEKRIFFKKKPKFWGNTMLFRLGLFPIPMHSATLTSPIFLLPPQKSSHLGILGKYKSCYLCRIRPPWRLWRRRRRWRPQLLPPPRPDGRPRLLLHRRRLLRRLRDGRRHRLPLLPGGRGEERRVGGEALLHVKVSVGNREFPVVFYK